MSGSFSTRDGLSSARTTTPCTPCTRLARSHKYTASPAFLIFSKVHVTSGVICTCSRRCSFRRFAVRHSAASSRYVGQAGRPLPGCHYAVSYFKCTVDIGPVGRRSLSAYEAAAITLYAASGRLIPFNSNSPTGSTFTAFSTFVSTRGLMRICPGLASSHSREATLDTVPMAA